MRRLAPLLLLFAACASTTTAPQAAAPCNPGHTILSATLWVQSAAEYRAAATQTFAAARRALDEALADPARAAALEETDNDPAQPPAVIVDVDETVLDNTPFEARVIAAGITYDETMWKQWTSEGAAPAIPGALEFLAYAKSRGVTVFYVTNRDEDERHGTLANLKRLGFPIDDAGTTLLLRKNKNSDKSPRRKHVADRYRVLLLAGDDLNDFAPNVRRAPWNERDALVTKMRDWWGTRWFMLPNPMYGSWEHAAIGGGTPCEQVERKIKALKR